jgi:uncharacterized protein (TIGR02596 family)
MKVRTTSRQAFSLIELIVVIAIIVIIASFATPAVNSVLRGSHLSQASGILVGQLSLARQQAISRNRQVEVRFYRFADPETPGENVANPASGAFRAMQIFEVRDNVAVPVDKIQNLPGRVIFSYTPGAGLSSLLDGSTAGTTALKKPGTDDKNAPRLPRGVDWNYDYVALRFLPDGSTDRKVTDKWFVTLINGNDRLEGPAKPPANFFTVQIDPVSGVTRNYRPSAG